MIKAILVDDEQHCLDTLSILLKEYCPEVQILAQCRSAKTGLEAIEKFKPNLVFLDIEMPAMNGFELIAADQILRCEADDNYTHLFLKNKTKIIACRTLKEVEEQLQDFSYFVRVHHSYLVNMNEVTRYVRGEGGYVIMSDGSSVN